MIEVKRLVDLFLGIIVLVVRILYIFIGFIRAIRIQLVGRV